MRGGAGMTSEEREQYRLGRLGLERGDSDAVLTHFGKLLATRTGFADVHYMLGLAHDQKDELDEASRSFQEALRINPAYTEARVALSSVCERLGDFEGARSLVGRATDRGRGSDDTLDATTRGKLANLQAALGDAYRDAGELREAIEAYRKALDRCPDYHDIRHRLAVALREAGLPGRAIEEFRRVLRANPDYLVSAVHLGITYYTLGRTGDAVRAWEKVLAHDPEREDAAMYLRMVREQNPESA